MNVHGAANDLQAELLGDAVGYLAGNGKNACACLAEGFRESGVDKVHG